jgi:multiple sugar transport system permease protein
MTATARLTAIERSAQEAVAATERAPRRRRPGFAKRVVVAALLVAFGVLFMYPFVWLVSASFKPRSEVFDNAIIPNTFTFENYISVWQEAPLALWLVNTVIVTVLASVTVTISSAMVAWGFSYFRFRGRNLLFGIVLATMMLPGAVTMIPTFLIWNGLGATGTLVPLWAGNLFGCRGTSSMPRAWTGRATGRSSPASRCRSASRSWW